MLVALALMPALSAVSWTASQQLTRSLWLLSETQGAESPDRPGVAEVGGTGLNDAAGGSAESREGDPLPHCLPWDLQSHPLTQPGRWASVPMLQGAAFQTPCLSASRC